MSNVISFPLTPLKSKPYINDPFILNKTNVDFLSRFSISLPLRVMKVKNLSFQKIEKGYENDLF